MPDTALIPMLEGMPPALLVERLDLQKLPDEQRHIALEDMCFVLDLPPEEKYDGTIERILRTVRPLSSSPEDCRTGGGDLAAQATCRGVRVVKAWYWSTRPDAFAASCPQRGAAERGNLLRGSLAPLILEREVEPARAGRPPGEKRVPLPTVLVGSRRRDSPTSRSYGENSCKISSSSPATLVRPRKCAPHRARITHFTLATSRPRYSEGKALRDANGYRVQDTEWHRITCFNGLDKTVQEYCDKGAKEMVRGRIHYTNWTDSEGVEPYGCEIIAETVDFLSRKKEDEDPQYIDNNDRLLNPAQIPRSRPFGWPFLFVVFVPNVC